MEGRQFARNDLIVFFQGLWCWRGDKSFLFPPSLATFFFPHLQAVPTRLQRHMTQMVAIGYLYDDRITGGEVKAFGIS